MKSGKFEHWIEANLFNRKYRHILEMTNYSKAIEGELKRIWENGQIETEYCRTFKDGELIPRCPYLIPYKKEEKNKKQTNNFLIDWDHNWDAYRKHNNVSNSSS